MAVRLLSIAVHNLYFMPTPQVYTAVTSLRVAEFNVKLKIFKFLFRYTILALFFIHKYPIFHMELTIFRDFPFGKVSIEQLNRFAPLRFSLSFQLRATNTRPLQLISVCICFPSFQLPVF